MAKRWFVTICHDFELHMAMINSHAHLRNKGCLRFSSISDKIWWISDRFRQMSPKSSVNVDVAVFWLHGYFWSICRHRFSGCGRRNTFATFSEDVLQFSWQAQHLGRVHRHFEGQAKHFRRVVLRVFANRNGRAASSGDKVQIPWQAWHFVRCDENWRKPHTKHRFWGGKFRCS